MTDLCIQMLVCKSKFTSYSLDRTQNLALVALVRLSGVYLGPPKSLFLRIVHSFETKQNFFAILGKNKFLPMFIQISSDGFSPRTIFSCRFTTGRDPGKHFLLLSDSVFELKSCRKSWLVHLLILANAGTNSTKLSNFLFAYFARQPSFLIPKDSKLWQGWK